jgi:hypothetical protein
MARRGPRPTDSESSAPVQNPIAPKIFRSSKRQRFGCKGRDKPLALVGATLWVAWLTRNLVREQRTATAEQRAIARAEARRTAENS